MPLSAGRALSALLLAAALTVFGFGDPETERAEETPPGSVRATPARDPSSGYPAESAFSLALHIHGSMSEQFGSMEWHTAKAESLGVDVIWWSDHDGLLSNWRRMNRYDFESAVWEPGWLRWKEVDDAWPTNFRYWQTDSQSNAFVQTSISDTLAFEGSRSLVLETRGQPGPSFSTGYFDQTTMQLNNRYSLAKRLSLALALFPEVLDPVDARFVVEVELSDHPDGVKILRYVAGTMDGEGVHSIPISFTPGNWNEYLLPVTSDAIEHFSSGGMDTLRAEDNTLGMVRIGLETRNGTSARVLFDDYRILPDTALVDDVLLDRARDIESYYELLYPSVTQYVGTEISRFNAQPHLNGFAPDLQLVNYDGYGWSDTIYYAVDQIHDQGGALSLNHAFGTGFYNMWNPDETPEEQAVRHLYTKNLLIDVRAYGADLLEVGYRQRGGMQIEHFLDLWDALNGNSIWITGNGVSDTHGRGVHNLIGWGPDDGSLSTTNNFVTWLYTEALSEAGFVKAMKRGRAYFGDPYRWQGTLDLRSTDGFRMGQVVFTDRGQHELVAEVANVPGDVQVRLLQAEIREVPPGEYPTVNYLRDEILSGSVVGNTFTDTLSIDTALSSLVRIEVYDGAGEEMVYGNPLCFVRTPPARGIPPERVAVRVDDIRVLLADRFTLRGATFDLPSLQLTISGDEEPAGAGSLSIDPGGYGAPVGVTGATGWTYEEGILTLQGFSGPESTVRVSWNGTGAESPGADPTRFRMSLPRPSPFRESTTIEYALPREGPVRLEVLDIAGRRVRVLESGLREAGPHRVWWDGRAENGRPAAAGVYHLLLRSAEGDRVRRVVKIR
jgi:hypothetical protein